MNAALHKEMITALEWYIDQGVDALVYDDVADHTSTHNTAPSQPITQATTRAPHTITTQENTPALLGKTDAYDEAIKLAAQVKTRDDLRKAIAEFNGISIKKTATNMVFSDGNPNADIMLIGEAPGADEDRIGKPFVGVSGQLLDNILRCIDLARDSETPENSVYISNIINWRPPGNRTPSPAEIEVSLPFIERHIQLIKPKAIILCGGVSAKALLGRSEGISRLRKTWHDYTPQTKAIAENVTPIPAIATYHPAYLLRTPVQKKAVWQDMLRLQERMKTF